MIVVAFLLGGLFWDGSPLGGLLVREAVHFKFKDVREVSPSALVAWMRDPTRPPPLIVDARPEADYALSHIAAAVRLDPVTPDLAVLAHVPRDQPVVAYDATGVGGAAMAVALGQAGFTRVSSLEGGLFRWANEGYPLSADSGQPTKVAGVSWGWDRLLKGRFHR